MMLEMEMEMMLEMEMEMMLEMEMEMMLEMEMEMMLEMEMEMVPLSWAIQNNILLLQLSLPLTILPIPR